MLGVHSKTTYKYLILIQNEDRKQIERYMKKIMITKKTLDFLEIPQ